MNSTGLILDDPNRGAQDDLIDGELSAEDFLAKARAAGNRTPPPRGAEPSHNCEFVVKEKAAFNEFHGRQPMSSGHLFIDGELSAEDFLSKARAAGNRMPSRVVETSLEAIIAQKEQIDAIAGRHANISGHPSTSIDYDLGGEDVLIKAQAARSKMPEPTSSGSSTLVDGCDDTVTNQDEELLSALPSSLPIRDRRLEPLPGAYGEAPGRSLSVRQRGALTSSPEEESYDRRAPMLQPSMEDPSNIENSSVGLIAAELVDDSNADMEAQIEERVGKLRLELIRDTVQADEVKVVAYTDFAARNYVCLGLMALILVFVVAGVTLGIVLSNSPKESLSSPGPQIACTLCPDGNITIGFPERKLPRLSEGASKESITCGAVASDPLLVKELLSQSSGDCNATIQIYANYCGCPMTSRTVKIEQCGILCSYGFVAPRKDLVIPVFNDTCGELESFYASLSSDHCKVANAVNVKASAAYCCTGVKPSCSLCPILGDKPSLSSNSAAPYFDLTCGTLNDYASILTSDECADLELPPAAGVCGCPRRECSLCGVDKEMRNRSLTSLYNNYSCAALDGIIGAFSAEDCSSREVTLISENSEHCCGSVHKPSSSPVFPPLLLFATQPPIARPAVSIGMEGAPSFPPLPSFDYPTLFPSLTPTTYPSSNTDDLPPVYQPSQQRESTLTPSTGPVSLCPICPDGALPPNPELLIPSGEGTCGELSAIVSSFTAVDCALQQDALNTITKTCC
jgi:hypothetical protein